jgi:hypothetical protein
MNFTAIKQQFLRDLKASAGKTALLAVLFLVGLCFWIPPLLKAFSSDASTASSTVSTNAPKPSVPTVSASTTSNSANAPTFPASRQLIQLLNEHPFLQPAMAAASRPRPFGIDADALPLPVLFAEEELAPPPVVVPEVKPIERLDGLLLKSTLIGSTRRAAMINNRLYHEGEFVDWKTRRLRLEAVERKAVTLSDGNQSWQLILRDSDNSDKQ